MNCIKKSVIKDIIKHALAEDIGRGDVTTRLLFPKGEKIQAIILADEGGIICGINIARFCFKLWDNRTRFIALVEDGDRVKRGQSLAKIYGKASSVLSAERVALNFLGLLSGVATRTNQFVNKVRDCRVRIMDTRKTLPGLRELEKYAVRLGGGYNHRFGLDDMILIKENHLAASCLGYSTSRIKKIIKSIKVKKPKEVKLEIEVRNLTEFKEALKAKPDIIMLDNMKITDIKKAITIRGKTIQRHTRPKPLLEASGNIDLENIRAYAQTGVDLISLGTLTKDIRCLDLSLELEKKGGRR